MKHISKTPSLLLLAAFASCRMQAPDVEYNKIVDVKSGESMALETLQEKPLQISYKHEFSADNVAPQVLIKDFPLNGKLSECTVSTDFRMDCLYTPNKGFSGSDRLSIVGRDGSFESSVPAYIYINVKRRGPRLDSISNQIITETQSIKTVDANDAGDDKDSNGNQISFKCYTFNTNSEKVECSTNTSLFFDNNSGSLNWQTGYSDAGVYKFEINAYSDELYDTKSFTVEVKNKNRAPVLDSINAQTVDRGQNISEIDLSVAGKDTDIDGEVVNYSCKFGIQDCSQVSGVSFSADSGKMNFNTSDATLTSYVFKMTVSDGDLTDTKDFIVNVIQNQAPNAGQDQLINLYKEESVTFELNLASDDKTNESSLNYSITTTAKNGQVSNCFTLTDSKRFCTYKPNSNFIGTDFFKYTVTDGELNSREVTISLVVKDKGPKLDSIANASVQEGSAITAINANDSGNDTDLNGMAISYSCLVDNKNCTSITGITFNTSTGLLNWTTNYEQAGVYNFAITGSSHGLTSTKNFTITVINNNRSPVINQIGDYTVFRGEIISGIDFNDAGDDLDIDGEALTYSCTANNINCSAANGVEINTTNGQIRIDSKNIVSNKAVIVVKSTDGDKEASTTFTVNVTENLAPVVGANQVESLYINTNIQFLVNIATDDRTLSGNLVYEIINNVQNGTLTNCFSTAGNRSCTYTPNANFIGEDSFTYEVIDQHGLTSSQAQVKFIVATDTLYAQESFNQNQDSYLKGVDIVWIVDDSGSMQDEQETLANNFSSFINEFIANDKKLDFKMAITTTDARERSEVFGRDANGVQWQLDLQASQNDPVKFANDFKKAVNVGINGSGSEKVYDSAHYMYSKQPAWFRNNDYLLVFIALTDEVEQSSMTTLQNSDLFKSYKDHPEKVKFYPIINYGANRVRFDELAGQMNSKVYDIYSPFNEVLNNLGTTIANQLKSFMLKSERVIIAESVEVYVNGVKVDAKDANGNVIWKFENNGIFFTESPTEGALINVNYAYKVN